MEESIYNLIPKEYAPPQKQPLYKSKYDPSIPPTGSTFAHHTTSIPKVSNLDGNLEPVPGPHTNKGLASTFGKPNGQNKKNQAEFTKKNTGSMGRSSLPPLKSRDGSTKICDESTRKPPIPSKDDAPIMGLVSNKNFILSNKVENILSQAKIKVESKPFIEKPEYGKVPKYLEKIKDNINKEYEHIRNMRTLEQEEIANQNILLPEEEIKALREGLKRKWDAVNQEYQKITHKSKLDTVGLRRKKEECEKEMAQIEKDLEKLNKTYICITTN